MVSWIRIARVFGWDRTTGAVDFMRCALLGSSKDTTMRVVDFGRNSIASKVSITRSSSIPVARLIDTISSETRACLT